MKQLQFEFTTIADAWFQLINEILDDDKIYIQKIQKGSFENAQYRRQFPSVAFSISHPHLDMIPIIPQGMAVKGVTPPNTMEYVENYFANYLMDPELAENETYKYASRIHEQMPSNVSVNEDKSWNICDNETQLEEVIKMLKKTPLTNQAVIEIAKPDDIVTCIGNDGKLDPPCLRLIDFKVVSVKHFCKDKSGLLCESIKGGTSQGLYICNGIYECELLTLTISVYFRSWDLWAGLPTNLGGLELLKQYVADECGLINGPMYAYSSGLHIYGYSEDFARIRTLKENK